MRFKRVVRALGKRMQKAIIWLPRLELSMSSSSIMTGTGNRPTQFLMKFHTILNDHVKTFNLQVCFS